MILLTKSRKTTYKFLTQTAFFLTAVLEKTMQGMAANGTSEEAIPNPITSVSFPR